MSKTDKDTLFDYRASAQRTFELGNRMLSERDYDMAFYCFLLPLEFIKN